ncbi:hypothetical protein O0L34_g5855 [Tuta absoluta]|nr:hypothetical protein O0L34_g5855 [Tuta absoluta]
MGSIDDRVITTSAILLFNTKAAAFEENLRNNLETFKELLLAVEQIKLDLETCETELFSQKQRCERKLCCSSEMYEKILESKNNIIQLAVSTAIRIDESKNLSILPELLKILCGDIDMLTPPSEQQDNKENILKPTQSTPNKHKLLSQTKPNSPLKKKKSKSPKKGLDTSLEDVSFRDESVSEIEGTPGRTSPIIQSKKMKNCSSISSGTSTDSREKKKCPDNWNTPEAKKVKLYYNISSPKRFGKSKQANLRQSRLSFVPPKQSNIVDLTCSPELSGGSGTSNPPLGSSPSTLGTKETPFGSSPSTLGTKETPFGSSPSTLETNENPLGYVQNMPNQNPLVQMLIKKEPSENDDTILPSPTSGPTNTALPRIKENKTIKKPLSLSRLKKEVEIDEQDINSPIIQFVGKVEKKRKNMSKEDEIDSLEESINILKRNRFKSPHKLIKQEYSPAASSPSPHKSKSPVNSVKTEPDPRDDDVTRCEESSLSILQHVNNLEKEQNSPSKRPLCENQNFLNLPTDPTMPPPRQNGTTRTILQDYHKRKIQDKVEPVYKEPTVRNKAEKMALPAWVCDECKAFFGVIYEDEPEKLASVVDRCSKHRGRNNPARPKTPPGFWNPRWSVPEDTEEFNRRNNVD